ncbi:MAG: CPBP family intramembrane metalloprotease [Planctomycetes bacterium]|jgi:membrane protease YdiL (CAAX protease family)|nr:CPBP family intramembrane metalloprotease [Planctomycetota bacterium]
MGNAVAQPANFFNAIDAVIVCTGVALFARWLLSTSLGREALARSKPRRNCMALSLPFGIFLLWLSLQFTAVLFGDGRSWQSLFVRNVVGVVTSLATVGVMLAVAQLAFARGIKGLGLRLRTIPQDLGGAFVTLLAVWPLVLAAMGMTMRITRMRFGPDYQIPQHEALKMITATPAVPLLVILVVMAVVVAPIVEEMLFRGLFQTMIRSHLQRPWLAIIVTSLLFAAIHVDWSHWPSLFMLALGLGYSYEKSGSLLRPIFMHAMFNGISIAAVLTQGAPGA